MPLDQRPYGGEKDFSRLLGLLSKLNAEYPNAGYLQPGDLTWWMRQNEVFDPRQSLQLFEINSELVGFVFSDPPEWAVIQAHPALLPGRIDQFVQYAEEKAGISEFNGRSRLTLRVFGSDVLLTDVLESRKYNATDAQNPLFALNLGNVQPTVTLPAGFHIRSVLDDIDDLRARVELHQAVWAPSLVTLGAYRQLRAAPPYRAELDLVAVAPDGRLASSALGWHDPATNTALFELVGTHPDFRSLGLAHAVLAEGLRRLRELGADRVVVGTDALNVAAIRLYTSAGFREIGRYLDVVVPAKPVTERD